MVKWLNQIFRGNAEVATQDQNSEIGSAKTDAEHLKSMADEHMNRGEHAAAEDFYRQALSKDPGFANAHCYLGFLLRMQGRLDEAIHNLQAAVRYDISQVDAHFMLGLISREKKDLESAVSHFRKAIQALRSFEPAYAELSYALTELGGMQEAISALEDGVRDNNESASLHYVLGQAYINFEEIDKAVLSFKRALVCDPAFIQSWVWMGDYARSVYLLDQALRYLSVAREIDAQYSGLSESFDGTLGEKKFYSDTSILFKAENVDGKRKVRLICATRSGAEQFLLESPTGRSVSHYRPILRNFELQLFEKNTRGLSALYNSAIEYAKQDPAILIFIHDDVHIVDLFWLDHIRDAMSEFDVVGVAGNTRRVPGQVAWIYLDTKFSPQDFKSGTLSGSIASGDAFPDGWVSYFGPAKQECKLLDGVLLAVDSEKLMQSGLRFDEKFDFHFYDLDFCRQTELKGLRMGTWPISIVHTSRGNYASESWRDGLRKYREKYVE